MLKYFLWIYILVLYPLWCIAQEPVPFQGSLTSLNNQALPKAHITLEPVNNSLMFNSQKIEVKNNGQFTTIIERPGLYHLSVRGVLHKSIRFPLWVRAKDRLSISVKLDPKNLDDGTYFGSDEYISWIRVTGNFNGYNFDQGVRFERINPRTLRAIIHTSLDTIRYQIVGITSGTTVLPGADDYQLRNYSDYEGIVAVNNDRVTLTYMADSTYYPNQNPYEGYRTTWDPDQTTYKFSNPLEDKIHKNLDSGTYFPYQFDYRIFDSDSLPADKFDALMARVQIEQKEIRIRVLEKVEKELSNTDDSALLQSLYFKYLYILSGLTTSHREILVIPRDFEMLKHTDREIIEASMEHLPPDSPLWSLHSSLVDIYPQALGFNNKVVTYLEKVVLRHPSDRVVGPLLLQLFKRSYDIEGNSDQTKEYYRYILERFGDDYYARKAREYARDNE